VPLHSGMFTRLGRAIVMNLAIYNFAVVTHDSDSVVVGSVSDHPE